MSSQGSRLTRTAGLEYTEPSNVRRRYAEMWRWLLLLWKMRTAAEYFRHSTVPCAHNFAPFLVNFAMACSVGSGNTVDCPRRWIKPLTPTGKFRLPCRDIRHRSHRSCHLRRIAPIPISSIQGQISMTDLQNTKKCFMHHLFDSRSNPSVFRVS